MATPRISKVRSWPTTARIPLGPPSQVHSPSTNSRDFRGWCSSPSKIAKSPRITPPNGNEMATARSLSTPRSAAPREALLRGDPLHQEMSDELSRLRRRHRVRRRRSLLNAMPCFSAKRSDAVHGVPESTDLPPGGPAVLDHLVFAP